MKKILIETCSRIALAGLLGAVLISSARAESFGINFVGNSVSTVSRSAGVVVMSGWTNIAPATFTSGTIRSSDGVVVATLTRSGPGRVNIWHSGAWADGANASLLDGYNDAQTNSPVTNVISGLTGSAYTVYLYMAGDAARPASNTDWLPNYTVNGVQYCTATVNGNGAFTGFVQGGKTSVNTRTYPPPVTYGNYLEITNVIPVGGGITISANSDNRTWRSPLNAIELVASSSAPLIQIPPTAQRLYTGSVAQVSVVAKGVNPLSYSWLKGGVNLNDGAKVFGSKTNSLTITNLALADTGDYAVVVTNAFGLVTSLVAHLEIVVPTTADVALDAFNAAFLTNQNNKTYYRRSLTNSTDDGTWTLALDILGMEDAYERTGSPQHKKIINDLCCSFLIINPPVWAWDGWNDDIGWMTMALIRGYQMTGTVNLLAGAEDGYNFAFARGWDTNFNDGGIWEQQPANMPAGQPPNKEALSNDSLGKVAAMLYQSTQKPVYLAQSEQIYAWVRTHIFDPNTGRVNAGVETNGTVNTGTAVYNQGTFIDYANLLYKITGNPTYYNDAVKAVEFTKNNLTSNNNGNGILNNNAGYLNTWADEFARGIGHLVKDNPQLWGTYYPWMVANANSAWTNRRTDLNLTWNAWAEPTPSDPGMIPTKAVSAVAMYQFTPVTQPGLVTNTTKLAGTIIGTPGSWNNGGDTIAKVFDNNISTFFDAPTGATGTWVGLDFGVGVSNVVAQINYWPRAGYENRMVGGVFQGDNNPNFTSPVTLFTVITVPPNGGVVTAQPITNRTAFRCVRYLAPANNQNCNVAEIKFFAPDPPPIPTGLVTALVSGSQLNVSWSASPGATSYKVKRSTSISGPFLPIASNVTNNFVQDSGLVAGTTYYYVVSASAFGVESANSTPAAGQPNNPIITNVWDGSQLNLSWPNGYVLMEATNLAGPWITNANAASPYVVMPTLPQKYYRVILP